MAQQKKEPDFSQVIETINNLETELIYKLEIGVDNGFCTLNGSVLKIDGKPICYPKDTFNSYAVAKFDPFMNRKLAYALFSMYTGIYVRENIDSDIGIESYFTTSDVMSSGTNKLLAVCKGKFINRNIPIEWVSNRFRNETVCWIDLILKMDNSELPYAVMMSIDDYIDYVRSCEAV